jgi:4-amino-4-deoxychorismate lyase
MNNIVAKRELDAAGAGPGTEGLFLNESGHICEGIVSNVFWLRGGILYTPSLECGPLAGVTRAYVMEMAASFGIRICEGAFRPEELASADEVFVTNSVQEIVPVIRLESETGEMIASYRTDGAGSLTRQWMKIYRDHASEGRKT